MAFGMRRYLNALRDERTCVLWKKKSEEILEASMVNLILRACGRENKEC